MTVAALISLRPLEWLKERGLPRSAAQRVSVELADGASSGPVLEAVERHGDLLALRRDGQRMDIEIRVDRSRRAQMLDALSALEGVEEARWAG